MVAGASANVTLPLLEAMLLCDTCDTDVRTETALIWLAKLSLLCDGRPADSDDIISCLNLTLDTC